MYCSDQKAYDVLLGLLAKVDIGRQHADRSHQCATNNKLPAQQCSLFMGNKGTPKLSSNFPQEFSPRKIGEKFEESLGKTQCFPCNIWRKVGVKLE